jgi:hypothetical protein
MYNKNMKKNIQKIIIYALIILPSFLLAQVPPAVTPTTVMPTTPTANRFIIKPPIGNGTDGGTDLRTIFMNVLDIAQTIMIMIATLYLLYSGFMFVTAKGDPGKIKTAQNALLWGLVGAALILTAEVLALGIGDTVKQVFQ